MIRGNRPKAPPPLPPGAPPPPLPDVPRRRAAMVKFDDAWLRAAEIAHIRWDRGFSYTKLIVTMGDGATFQHSDHRGSAYELEKSLLEAIEGLA